MEKKKYDLLIQLFGRLQEVDALDKMLVIGSWCMLFYERYFDANDFHSAIRTRDVDLLIPIPFRLRKKINLHGILEELGFVVVFKGRDGYQTFQHPMF